MNGVREKCWRGKELLSELQSRYLKMGYSLTHQVLETSGAAAAKVFSGWHSSCSPWACYQGRARPNYTLLNVHLHILLYCAREACPWITPSSSTDIWQLLMQQTQHSGEEVIISPVLQRGGNEMQRSNYFSQVAERKCVSVTAASMSSGCELGGIWTWRHKWILPASLSCTKSSSRFVLEG